MRKDSIRGGQPTETPARQNEPNWMRKDSVPGCQPTETPARQNEPNSESLRSSAHLALPPPTRSLSQPSHPEMPLPISPNRCPGGHAIHQA
jgi:hypothetical protein